MSPLTGFIRFVLEFYKDAAPTALPKIAQPFKAGLGVGK